MFETTRRLVAGRAAPLIVVGLACLSVVSGCRRSKPSSSGRNVAASTTPEVIAVRPSEFLNAREDATFVGQRKCAECHPDAQQTFGETAHSRALAPLDPSQEPADGEFYDAASNRGYRVFRRDGKVWHRESMRTQDGDEIVLAEYPVRWVIGSGRFSRSYLIEPDGFLMESPITWYASRQRWALSPGYERYNSGFERPTEIRCINCHVGRAAVVDGSPHRIEVHAHAIDCERCHGPGSLHVGRRESGQGPSSGPDLTIVHPGRLERQRGEAICAQCHLHSAATVAVRGRQLSDFRPGLHISDFSIPYGFESPNESMSVVGHMEQMRLSRCYQETDSLTCITCHDPHRKPSAEERLQYYRSVCLECHAAVECGIPATERRKQSPMDDCIACHMPTSPTDIPHFAFTHHRIGVHDSRGTVAEGMQEPETLVPLEDISHLGELDRERCLGLAYAQAADLPEQRFHAEVYRERARSLLEQVRGKGLRDPAVDAALARLYWQVDPARTATLAQAVLDADDASADDRATALFTLGTTALERGATRQALTLLRELVRVRRYSDGWFALSICLEDAGDLPGAVRAATKAVEISPDRPDMHERLARLLLLSDQPARAMEHQQRARQISEVPLSR